GGRTVAAVRPVAAGWRGGHRARDGDPHRTAAVPAAGRAVPPVGAGRAAVPGGGGPHGARAVGRARGHAGPAAHRARLCGRRRSVGLFTPATAPYTQEFVVPGALPWRGFLGQAPGEENRVPVEVWYTLKRPRGTPFGERPLPGGIVQLYQADSAGRLQLVGEARTTHTAPGRDLRVQSGDAFDITAERVQTDYGQEQLAPPKRGVAQRQRITAS